MSSVEDSLKAGRTTRGFSVVHFKDLYHSECSVQLSSLASQDAIWLGVDDAKPQILASKAGAYGLSTDQTTGWVPYPIPDAVLLTTRMHLTREDVAALLPILQHFVETGEVTWQPPSP